MNRRTIFAAPALAVALAAPAIAQSVCAPNTLAAIKTRGKLLAGVKFDTPPFGYLDDNDKPAGFDLEIMRKVAAKIGVPVEFVKVTSLTRIPLLLSGGADLVAASMTHTREREKTIDFSMTYYTGGQSLLVPNGSAIASTKDLAGKQVAVQQGTTLEKTLAQAAPAAKITAFKDYDGAWMSLAQGRADALTGSLNILQGFAKQNKGFRITGGLFSTEPFGIGIRKGDWAMRDAVNETLQDLQVSGDYDKMYLAAFASPPAAPIEVWP